jgi:hypothetical protein
MTTTTDTAHARHAPQLAGANYDFDGGRQLLPRGV